MRALAQERMLPLSKRTRHTKWMAASNRFADQAGSEPTGRKGRTTAVSDGQTV